MKFPILSQQVEEENVDSRGFSNIKAEIFSKKV